MGARGTGGSDRIVGALQSQMDRQETRHHVDDGARHEEGRYTPRTLLDKCLAAVFDIGQAADTGPHRDADALPIGVSDLQPGITHRLETRGKAVLNEEVEFACLFCRQILLDIEAFDRPAKTSGIGRKIHVLDQADTTAAGENSLPAAWHIVTQWR